MNLRLVAVLVVSLVVCGCWAKPLALRSGPLVHSKEVLSESYLVDQLYPSMRGPASADDVYLEDPAHKELLWIVGYETEVVDGRTALPLSQEFMCHANLDLSPPLQRLQSIGPLKVNGRIFTLSQGQQKISFPDGFGIPILSSHPLQLSTQVLNLNKPGFSRRIRHKVKIHYLKDSELKTAMTGLFMLGVEVL